MKILIPESISEAGVDLLRKQSGFSVDYQPGMSFDSVCEVISDYHGIITRSGTAINDYLLEKAKRLKIIGRAGVGVDNIDIDAASRRGILVINVPAGNIVAATEHTIAMLMATTRQIPQADKSIRDGKWDRKSFMGVEFYKKTLGIIGFGKIGTRVAKRMKAFDMTILAYDPYLLKETIENQGVVAVDLDRLLAESDFITVHTPLTEETVNLINENEFAKMKKGVRIVNCARGGIYNENALKDACLSGKVYAAAVDVFSEEPISKKHPLIEVPQIILTPHLGANTEEAQENVSIEVCRDFIEFNKSGFLPNALNAPFTDVELAKSIGPYMQLMEKMARISEQIFPDVICEITVSVSGLSSDSLKALTVSAVKGILSPILGESVNYVNAMYEAKERQISVKWLYSESAKDYHAELSLTVASKNKTLCVKGTCFSQKFPRVTSIDEFNFELDPKGTILLIRNNDVPGIIGQIGTLFGVFNINIAEYRLARSETKGQALAAIALDQKPESHIVQKLSEINGIIEVHLMEL